MKNILLLTSSLFLLCITSLTGQIPCNGEFLNTGTAIDVGDCIQLTSNTTGQQGCTWLNTPVDFNQPFTHTMVMNFGNSEGGADGICLVYQPNGPNTCGMTGGAIGAAGIPNSFIVEFDTWNNGASQSDIAPDHCATSIFGDLNNQIDPPVSLGQIEDGNDHTVTFSWNPAGTSYTISFDGVPIISGVYDIINLVFGGNSLVYWGYTASTGAAFNTQSVCPTLPPPIMVDAGIDITVPCADGQITLDATNTDFGATYFYSWSSPNGGIIVSGGNTLTPTVMGPGTYILTLTDSNGGCMETDEVVVTLDPLEAIIAPPPLVPCFGNTVFLDGSASSSGPFITYQWTTPDGNIVSGANSPIAEINAPGTYTLTVIYNDGNTICTEEATVQAIQDTNLPTAFAVGGEINCYFPTIQLDASGSSSGPDFTYEWSTGDGQILDGANTQFPTVGSAGTYTLIVTNNFNGCFDTYDVVVEEDTDPPVAVAIATDSLGCQTEEVTLDGTGSTTGSGITYEWSTMDGNILSGVDGLMPVVDQAGTYTLFVSNDDNGCFESASVEVIGGAAALIVDIAPADTLDCGTSQFPLDATASAQDTSYTYSWTTADGNIISGADSLMPLIDTPGNYVLSISSPDGCIGMDSVKIIQDTMLPIADAGTQQALSCDEPTLTLDGSGSSSGNDYNYQWTTSDGNIVSGAGGLMPVVNAPGLYLLQITDTTNSCTAVDSVEILNDAAAPTVSIAPPDTLNCNLLQQTLDASASSQGLGFDFEWTTSGGNFLNGQNSLQPTVNGGGQYTLSITNLNNNCTTISSIFVEQDTTAPNIDILPADTLNCTITALSIDATSSSSGNNYSYQWTTTNGNILSGGQSNLPEVDAAGTYELTVNNTQNGCQSISSIQVVQDTVAPAVSLVVNDTLDCLTDTLLLDGSGSSQGSIYSFTWVAPDPGAISNTSSLQASANAAGMYSLLVVNNQNSCQSTATLEVVQDTLLPTADAGPDMVINCYNESQILDGTNSTSAPDINYQWLGGTVDSGGDTPSPSVSQSGTYILEVSNSTNNCSATDTVLVSENFEEPSIAIDAPGMLTCTDSLIMLDASASSQGAAYDYNWTTSDGSIFSGADSNISTVSQSGTYFLEITNTISGCSVEDSVQVMQDVDLPVANIIAPSSLTCAINSIQLDGTNSSQGSNIVFQWSTQNGNIAAGANTLTPNVDAPGNYTLQITDQANDCQTVAVVEVPIDTVAPLTDAGSVAEINCNSPSTTLDGSGTVQGSNYTYQWNTAGGNILSGADGLSPVVDAAGLYTLSVQDTDNGCLAQAEVNVTEDFQIPYLEIAAPGQLTCSNTIVGLDATASETAPYISYSWTTTNGTLTGGADVLLTATTAPGLYQLVILNENNGCSDTSSVMVSQDTIAPVAQIAPATVFTCVDTTQMLDATASSAGPEFEYSWTTNDGIIAGGDASNNPEIVAPGTYQLEVENTQNGCTANADVNVTQDITIPDISITQPEILTCDSLSTDLVASILNAGNQAYSYSWSTTNGSITSGTDNSTAEVAAAGSYTVEVIDMQNGCMNSIQVQVQQDTTTPEVAIEFPDTLTCFSPSVSLDANASSNGFLFENNWTTANGQILSGATTLGPNIAAPGTYTLTIENSVNGCQETQSVEVAQDIALPALSIETADTITCTQTAITLDASDSSNGSVFAYQWTSTDGNILSGSQQPSPIVDAPGIYTLSIQNIHNGCLDSLSVQVSEDVELPEVVIAQPEELTCATIVVNLDGQQSSTGSNFDYLWTTTEGNITGANSLPTATVNEPGSYTLSITNTANGCVDSLSTEVPQDTTLPSVNINTPDLLTCELTQFQLDASSSSSGPDFTYQWSTQNGNLLNGEDSPEPAIDAPGIYTLLINNTDNGCEDSLSVMVMENTTPPDISLLPADTLTCAQEEVSLVGVSAGTTPMLVFSWSSDDGNISGATDEISTLVTAPGLYTLRTMNAENGCMDTVFTMVAQDTLSPDVAIVEPSMLTCAVQSLTLDGTASSAGLYSWASDDGSILSGADTPVPLIDAPGSYILTVLSSDNGCTQSAAVEVGQDITPPSVAIAEPGLLTCAISSLQLDAGQSSSGPEFVYDWQVVSNGSIVSGADGLNPVIDAPGLYELLITNTENGCEDELQVSVGQDIIPPVAIAGEDFILPCFEPSTQLNGSGSSEGPEYTYTWSTADGSLINGQQSLTPSVNEPGTYQLTILNNQNGCESEDVVMVIQDIPTASVEFTAPLCYGDLGNIFFSAVEGGVSPYVYSIDGGDAFYPSGNFTGLTPGNYELTVQDINGCEYEQQVMISQPDSMVVRLNIEEVDLQLGESHQVVLQTNIPDTSIASVSWSNTPGLSCYDCQNPIAMPTQTTDYRVEVVSKDGCRDEAYIRIYVDKTAAVYIPNIFSPNGDGANDVFHIFARAGTVERIHTFRIFNRWGEPMFEDFDFQPNTPEHGWDGYFRGELLNSGVFAYYAEIEFTDGRIELFEGDVTLFR